MRQLSLALLFLLGCGYHFVAQGVLPDGVRSVSAPVFVNRTPEPALEATFTDAFREELQRRGELGGSASDARLEGELVSVTGAPTLIAPTTHQLASYRLTARVRLKLVKGGRVLSAADVSGTEDYLPAAGEAGDVLRVEANRQAALGRLARTLARIGLDRLSDEAP